MKQKLYKSENELSPYAMSDNSLSTDCVHSESLLYNSVFFSIRVSLGFPAWSELLGSSVFPAASQVLELQVWTAVSSLDFYTSLE